MSDLKRPLRDYALLLILVEQIQIDVLIAAFGGPRSGYRAVLARQLTVDC